MEIDGAERCDCRSRSRPARLHNWTVIGAGEITSATDCTPDSTDNNSTDRLVELRDNARVQFLNCIFMRCRQGESCNDKVISDGEVNNNTTVCGPGSAVPQTCCRACTTSASHDVRRSTPFPGCADDDLDPGAGLPRPRTRRATSVEVPRLLLLLQHPRRCRHRHYVAAEAPGRLRHLRRHRSGAGHEPRQQHHDCSSAR